MILFSLLNYVLIAIGLILVFRHSSDRVSQYISIASIGFSSFLILGYEELISFPSRWNLNTVLPFGLALLGLILFVRLSEKSFPLLMAFIATLQILIATEFVKDLI